MKARICWLYGGDDGSRTPHNTITPIARLLDDGIYEIDLVLRNNRTSEEHPMGIFHPHQHLHHIKKENIGLIEVMGLAVLPGRLKSELEQIAGYLTGATAVVQDGTHSSSHPLHLHAEWIESLAKTLWHFMHGRAGYGDRGKRDWRQVL